MRIFNYFCVVIGLVCIVNCGGSGESETHRILAPEYLEGSLSFAPGENIPATMERLQESMTVRILFYGQSISEQDWIWQVTRHLEKKYPDAVIIAEERARGGWTADRLVTVYEEDVFTWDPDLVIFQEYGNEKDYETIVRGIRGHVNARGRHVEMLITNEHVHITNKNDWYDFRSWSWLPGVARRFKCGFVDVRTPWYHVIEQEHDGDARALLKDYIHLNGKGNRLYAELVEGYFPR